MKTWLKIFVAFASVRRIAAFGLAVSSATACARSAESAAESPPTSVLGVSAAWARAADSGATTAVYFAVGNASTASDTLIGVRTDAAEEIGLHMSMEKNGTMHMVPLRTLPVPAQDSLIFRPMGAHLMLTRLRRALTDGDTVRVTLEFVSGRSIEVRADVRRP